jgi:hypothetical protein
MPELHRRGEVYLVDLGDDENRFSLDWMVRPLAGKDPGTLGAIKATIYTAAIAALNQAPEVTLP